MNLYLQLITASILTGLIWTVQLVHYPSFAWVNVNQFSKFEAFHGFRISIIVIPLMLTELALVSLALISNVRSVFSWWSFVSVLCIWGVTFFWSVPCHQKLSSGFDASILQSLLYSNGVRTMIWTFRTLFLAYSFYELHFLRLGAK